MKVKEFIKLPLKLDTIVFLPSEFIDGESRLAFVRARCYEICLAYWYYGREFNADCIPNHRYDRITWVPEDYCFQDILESEIESVQAIQNDLAIFCKDIKCIRR